MVTAVDEIADGVFRLSTHRPDGLPGGLTYNQFLIRAAEPLLMHTGMRCLFPDVLATVERLIDVRRLRWISGGHASRPDEFGSVNEWLALAPHAEVIAGGVAVGVCLRHMVDREPKAMRTGETLDLGDHRVSFHATPHVPFWEAGVLHDETTGTLFCGDLFTVEGDPPAITTTDIVEPALDFERRMQHFTVSRHVAPTLRRLAGLHPRTLACMHGPAFAGDTGVALHTLADHYDQELANALP